MSATGGQRLAPGNHGGSRPRVLVIDDDEETCDFMRRVPTAEGYAVGVVGHGAAALEVIKTHEPNAIILDLRMPIMDGRSFIQQYRRVARPPAPIIVISGVRDAQRQADALHADGFLTKPFDLETLLGIVARCLHGIN